MKSTIMLILLLLTSSVFATPIDSQTLAGAISTDNTHSQTMPANSHQEILQHEMMFGLKPNMTVDQVKKLGVSLTPYIEYVTPSQYDVHAFYGMNSYQAANLPQIFNDSQKVILSFNRNQDLKMIQVQSQTFKDQASFQAINQRIKTIADKLANAYGHYSIANQAGKYGKSMPIYIIKDKNLWITITSVLKSQQQNHYNLVYVVKYFVQNNA